MLTREKQELINECLQLSRLTSKVVYGFIIKNEITHVTTVEEEVRILISEHRHPYCKAQGGYLIL